MPNARFFFAVESINDNGDVARAVFAHSSTLFDCKKANQNE